MVNANAGMRRARAEDLEIARSILEGSGMTLERVECAETGSTAEECARHALSEGREVRISADAPLAVHADGRAAGTLPATFRCRAGALAVYVPAESGDP